MEKGKIYLLKKNFNQLNADNLYMLLQLKKIDNRNFYIKIGQVYAILIDKIIFSNVYELITDNKENIFGLFKEISLDEARKLIDNTSALLDKNIFRR